MIVYKHEVSGQASLVVHIMFMHNQKNLIEKKNLCVYEHAVQDQANLVIHCMFVHTLLLIVLTFEFRVYLSFFFWPNQGASF